MSLALQESVSSQVDPASRLPYVVDEHGAAVPRANILARERTLLLECLALAVALQPRSVAAEDVLQLAEAARALAAAASGSGGDPSAAQHTYVAAVALLAALLPVENAEGAEMDADEQALGACCLLKFIRQQRSDLYMKWKGWRAPRWRPTSRRGVSHCMAIRKGVEDQKTSSD